MADPVLLFELTGRDAQPRGTFSSLAAAAAATPPGAYTTLRTFEGRRRVLAFAAQLRRLEESAARLGDPAQLVLGAVAAALSAALAHLPGTAETRVRLTLTRPGLFAALEPFAPRPESARRDGVTCTTVPERRSDARCKDTRFADVARRAAAMLPEGVHEGLMVDDDGALLEGLSSNFFAVCGGELRTEGERVLPGVTRGLILDLARERVPVSLRPVTRADLPALTEAFLSSTSRGVLPVVAIDGVPVGAGHPGPLTRDLMQALEQRIARDTRSLDDLAQA